MTYRTRTTYEKDFTLTNGETITVKLSGKPSSIMEYKEFITVEKDGKLVVGYLADDGDCNNPLEDCDGMGHIYSAHRHSGQHAEMQQALGLDQYWSKDLGLVSDEAVVAAALKEIKASAEGDNILFDRAMKHIEQTFDPSREPDFEMIDEYFEDLDELTEFDGPWIESIYEMLFAEGRDNGTIGNKYVVSLDVYAHSGVSYSVSGQGMQCAFDTARGGAVWVPDDCCIEHIESFSEEERGKAAIEAAQSACEQYTAWCNGDCYGIVVETFDLQGKQLEEDACWGFVGGDYAMEALAERVKEVTE